MFWWGAFYSSSTMVSPSMLQHFQGTKAEYLSLGLHRCRCFSWLNHHEPVQDLNQHGNGPFQDIESRRITILVWHARWTRRMR